MFAALLLTGILAVLSLFQLALLAGLPLGLYAWGGSNRVLPPRLRAGSAVSILIYAVIAVIALDRAGLLTILPDAIAITGTWVFFTYFVLGIGLNPSSRSKKERLTMVPVSIALAVVSLVVALG